MRPLPKREVLFLRAQVCLLIVSRNMLHALFPGVRAPELRIAEAAVAQCRWGTELLPAPLPDAVKTHFEGFFLGLWDRLLVGLCICDPGRVHTALVLDEEVFAVEVIDKGGCCRRGGVLGVRRGWRRGRLHLAVGRRSEIFGVI